MYLYYLKFNGKITKLKTKDFVRAHNRTFWAGKKYFKNLIKNKKIPVQCRLINSKKDYLKLKKNKI